MSFDPFLKGFGYISLKFGALNRIILVGCEVVGFTRSREAVLVDAARHHHLAVVDHGSEHGPGRLHGRQLLPLRLLVVVNKHLVEDFAVETKMSVS